MPDLVGSLDARRVLALQATAGNRAVTRLLSGRRLARQPQRGGGLADPVDDLHGQGRGTRNTYSDHSGGREIDIDEQVVIQDQGLGEMQITTGPEVRWLRRIRIRTPEGATAEVTIRGSAVLPGDARNLTPEAALDAVGEPGVGATFEGRLANGAPVRGIALSNGSGTSLRSLANSSEDYMHFGLSPDRQYQTIVDALNRATPLPARQPGQSGPPGQRTTPDQPPQAREPLTPERLEQMTEEEKSDRFWDEVWERFLSEFSIGEVAIAIGIGVVVGILGALAIVIGTPFWIGAFIVAAVLGLGYLLYKLVSELIDDLRTGDTARALLGLLKNVALIVAAVAGALAVLAAAEVIALSAAALTVLAFVALGIGLLAMLARLFLDRERAVESHDPAEFERAVQDGARTIKEGVITIVTTIVSLILGPILGRVLPRGPGRGAPGTELPPGEGEGEGARPVPREGTEEPPRGMPHTRATRPAAPVEPPRLPNGDIDFVAWQQRLLARGIRGDVAGRVARAQAGDVDAVAELRSAERYADAGYEVEIVAPEENAGVKNPDLRIRLPGTRPIRAEVKSRTGQPISRQSLNGDVSDASKQISGSREGRGDIIVDASAAPEGPFDQAQVEGFLRGRMSGNRYAPGARLKDVDYLEITYRDRGGLKRSWMQRNENGDAQGPFTEDL